MKACSKCTQHKPESEFFIRNKVTGRLHAQCKDCYKKLRQISYAKHYQKYKDEYRSRAKKRRLELRMIYRANMLKYLSNKECVSCGESDVRVLEFDHLNPFEKKFSVSQAVKLGYSWNEVVEEIKKCRILCANCHKKHTATQENWYKQ